MNDELAPRLRPQSITLAHGDAVATCGGFEGPTTPWISSACRRCSATGFDFSCNTPDLTNGTLLLYTPF